MKLRHTKKTVPFLGATLYIGCVKINFLRQDFRKISYYSLLMHAFSYPWSFPVTWKRWHHTTGSTIPENPRLCTNLMALDFIKPVSWAIEVYIAGIFWLFLHLLPWPLPDDLYYTKLTHICWRYTGCANMNFQRQGFWKLSSHRHTDIIIIGWRVLGRT